MSGDSIDANQICVGPPEDRCSLKKFKATLTVTQSRNGAKPKQILKKNVKFKK